MKSILVMLVGTVISAAAGSPKLAKDLKQTTGDVEVIVQYEKPPSATHVNKVKGRGGSHKASFAASKSAAFTVPASKLAELASDLDVTFIAPDRPLRGALDVSRSSSGAFTAQSYGWTGAGVGVAVIDSGTQDHADIKSNIVYSQSFVPGVADTDVQGHGIHVAGIVAGGGSKSSGTYKGIAPGAKLIILKALDDNGVGKDSWVIAATNRAIELKATYNIRVINLSLGRPVRESYKTDPLCQAVEAAWKAGIVVVTSAGNEGRNNLAGTYGYGTISSLRDRTHP